MSVPQCIKRSKVQNCILSRTIPNRLRGLEPEGPDIIRVHRDLRQRGRQGYSSFIDSSLLVRGGDWVVGRKFLGTHPERQGSQSEDRVLDGDLYDSLGVGVGFLSILSYEDSRSAGYLECVTGAKVDEQ